MRHGDNREGEEKRGDVIRMYRAYTPADNKMNQIYKIERKNFTVPMKSWTIDKIAWHIHRTSGG